MTVQTGVLQFCAVQTIRKAKLSILMACHMLWGLFLWFSISKYGLGISSDAAQLLSGGQNLAEGRGLGSYDGTFVSFWPPLYPVLLGKIHLLTGWTMLTAAAALQAAAFIGLSACLSILFLRMFPNNFLLALAANVLSDIGAVVLISFDMVGADYVHLCLAMLCVVLTGVYIESRGRRTFAALAVAGMLAMLDRYIGVAGILTAVTAVWFMTDGGVGQRLARGFVLLLGAAPAGIWLAITSKPFSLRAPISFSENFNWFSKSVLEWFFASKPLKAHLELYTALLWIFVLVLIGLVLIGRRQLATRGEGDQTGINPAFSVPVFAYGGFYLAALFGSASIAYFNKLGGRFLLPLYIPFIALLVAAVGVILRKAAKADSSSVRLGAPLLSMVALALVAGLLLQITLPLVWASHADGATGGENVYNTRDWNRNQALQYWLGHEPQGQYLLLSDVPDGAALSTQHAATSSPRSSSGPYATDNYALSTYAPELFSAGQPVYLLWIEPRPADYFYTVADLAAIAKVEPLFVSDDGGVYRLTPKAAP
jgi:hypothetical protein